MSNLTFIYSSLSAFARCFAIAPPSSSRNVEYIQNQVMTSKSPQLKIKPLFRASSPGPTAVVELIADLEGLKMYVYPVKRKKNISLTGAIVVSVRVTSLILVSTRHTLRSPINSVRYLIHPSSNEVTDANERKDGSKKC